MEEIKLPESITVKDFSKRLNKSVSETISILMENGFLVTINEVLDYDTAAIIAEDMGFKVEKEETKPDTQKIDSPFDLATLLKKELKEADKKQLKNRPPIVTILGHVDHGKTTLLDTIRKTKVAEGESGGITQHITAYQVKIKNKTITFVDTPGHEAFQKMRARGAGIADIAVVIIDAEEGVKPQTKEVLKSIKQGKLPFVICLNKIDKAGASPDKVKGQLAEEEVLVEGWGGKVPVVEISAKENINIDDLLETILLISEIEDLKANYARTALGLVLESHLDKKRGPVATLIIKSGTLRKGNYVCAGKSFGKIKLIEDFRGKGISEATPSMPVTVLGFSSLPQAGSVAHTIPKEEAKKKQISSHLEEESKSSSYTPLRRIEKSIEKGKYKKLNIIVKADTKGSLEAIEQILNSLVVQDVATKIVKTGVGQVTESDILLAKISNALLYGFRVSESQTAIEVQEKERIKPRFFDVIYHLTEDVQKEMEAIVTIEEVRVEHGTLKVLAIFKTGKKDMIIGGRVTKGEINVGDLLDITRGGEFLGRGKITQMKKGKEDFTKSYEGEECGLVYEPIGNFIKIREGDELLVYALAQQTKNINQDDTK